jgi:ParB/RepB/Spo0J family partition protein
MRAMSGMFDTQITEILSAEIKANVHIKNIRTVFHHDGIQQLAESIQRDGLMQPIVVMPAEDDEGNNITELVAGERRLRAIRLIQERDPDFMSGGVPCVYFEGSLHDAKYLNAVENVERENIDDVDLAAWVYRRVTFENVSQTELAEKIHRSASWVNFRIVFHEKATDAVKAAVRDGTLSFTAAYHMAKNMSQEEQIKWIEKARKLGEKIKVENVTAGDDGDGESFPTGNKKPGKKKLLKMLARADKLADSGNELARGMSFSIRWFLGDFPTEDMEDLMLSEESK